MFYTQPNFICSLQGMDSGFHDDEAYNVYDRPFRQESSIANNIYRPSKNVDKDIYGDDFDSLMKTNRLDDIYLPCYCLDINQSMVESLVGVDRTITTKLIIINFS